MNIFQKENEDEIIQLFFFLITIIFEQQLHSNNYKNENLEIVIEEFQMMRIELIYHASCSIRSDNHET